MTEKIIGIILNVRKHTDRNCIVTLYTLTRGRISFISPVGSGKASNVRRAKLQPLSLISTDLNFKPTSELQRLGSISSPEIFSDIYFHPVKRTLTIFISEFLDKLLMAASPDPPLFEYLNNSIRFLDKTKSGINNFHIPFLVSLLPFAGIQPDTSGYAPGKVFSFTSGTFLFPNESVGPALSPEESKYVATLCRINFSNMKCLRLTNANRRQILYALLNYYSFHFPGIGSMKSPEILREIFS